MNYLSHKNCNFQVEEIEDIDNQTTLGHLQVWCNSR